MMGALGERGIYLNLYVECEGWKRKKRGEASWLGGNA
jgi:hypothetical protein